MDSNDPIQGPDRISEIRNEKPLITFSLDTHNQLDILLWLAQEIRTALDTFDGSSFARQYSLSWLWVIGAYELTRTMSHVKSCFTDELGTKLLTLKKVLASLRMPFAKQEYQGKGGPILGEASVSDFDVERKDLTFTVNSQDFSVRNLLDRFESVLCGIKLPDILRRHEEALEYQEGQPPAQLKIELTKDERSNLEIEAEKSGQTLKEYVRGKLGLGS